MVVYTAGDVYTSLCLIHDTPENMTMLLQLFSMFMLDAEKENDACTEGMNVESLLKNYGIVCYEFITLQTFFATSAEGELSLRKVCGFFDRYYRNPLSGV